MPYKVLRFQDTPNPNALKCVLDRSPPDVPRSYLNASSAGADRLASALFAIPGVTSVLISDGWLTVNKSAETAWGKVKPAVEQVLAAAE